MPVRTGDATANGGPNALPSSHFPGVYEYVLEQLVGDEVFDVEWPLSKDTNDAALAAKHDAAEAEQVLERIAQRRGEVLSCQEFHLPDGAGAPFRGIPCRSVRSFFVDPTDLIVYQPPPERA
jgi:hypothetical protein